MPILLIDEIQPKNAGDFPMVQDVYFKGGFRVVADTTARDAITDQRKTVGMVAHVVSDGNDYRWNGTTWDLIIYSSAVNWGEIGGDLEDQTDLQDELDLKADASDLDDLVVGPASATDTAIALFDTTTGKLLKNSVILVDSSGNISGIGSLNATGNIVIGDTKDVAVVGVLSNGGTGGVRNSLISNAGGDCQYNLNANADVDIVTYSVGLDDSDGHVYKEQFSTLVGTDTHRIVNQEGIQTLPLQPMFSAGLSAAANNVTGNGDIYTIVFNATTVNKGGSYDTTTGIFTAPATGTYLFTGSAIFSGLAAGNTSASMFIVTTVTTFNNRLGAIGLIRDTDNRCSGDITRIVAMSEGDTCRINTQVSGTSKDVDIIASIGGTNFSGFLIG